jgi:hypothetical protein
MKTLKKPLKKPLEETERTHNRTIVLQNQVVFRASTVRHGLEVAAGT